MSTIIKNSASLTKHQGKELFSEDFLLSNSWSQKLYHGYAAKMPIIDYHNHLSPELIAVDHEFSSITQLWLEGDHYKWRAMRANGISEEYITGKAPDDQKFEQWAKTVPATLRNPLFHWTHLELRNPFGIETYLDSSNQKEIYDACNEQLRNGLTVQKLLKNYNVESLCTTDDPIDDLRFHKAIKKSGLDITILPTFRPDKLLLIERGRLFSEYVDSMAQVVGFKIDSLSDLEEAIALRHRYFDEMGCKLTDIGLESFPTARPDASKADKVFKANRNGQALSVEEVNDFKSYVLNFVCLLNAEKGWVQQFHVGAIRNNNSSMLVELGPDTGFDSINDINHIAGMSRVLDELQLKNGLAKTIGYNLDPSKNDAFATMLGNFNDGSVAGKMQFGAAWWFLDQKKGMLDQLDSLSNMGLLSRFVGMLTDSRSFVSFSRHEYFRRILCDMLGREMQSGELPQDDKWVGQMVQDICYYNAKNYFDFN